MAHHRQIFSVEQEQQLASFVRDAMQFYGHMSSKEVCVLAYVYAYCFEVRTPLVWINRNQASIDWCSAFLRRNQLHGMVAVSYAGSIQQPKNMPQPTQPMQPYERLQQFQQQLKQLRLCERLLQPQHQQLPDNYQLLQVQQLAQMTQMARESPEQSRTGPVTRERSPQ